MLAVTSGMRNIMGRKKELFADHFDGPEVGGTSSEQQQCARAQLL
jgi:hypothetical protein